MTIQFKLKSFHSIALALTLSAASLQAQSPVVAGSITDEKFANTTIVFKKDSNANDAQVLSALESDMGIGDVVRITVAPPKPTVKAASALPANTSSSPVRSISAKPASTDDLVAGTDPSFLFSEKTRATTPVLTTRSARMDKDFVAVPAIAVNIPAATPVPTTKKAEPVAAPVPVMASAPQKKNVEKSAVSTESAKRVKSSASAKTSKSSYRKSKKSNGLGGLFSDKKYRKKGKQRYGCFKF